jgi:hypothetical protein
MADMHPGHDGGTHDVEVPMPSCGHPAATGRSRCPECGSKPVVAIGIRMNESIVDHNRMQREYVLHQQRLARGGQ